MLSMTICGLASGSSQGRSAKDFCCVDCTPGALELARRRRATAARCEKRTLDDHGSRHTALPDQFTVHINFRPDDGPGLKVRCIDHSKCDIALASGRPRRRADAANFLITFRVGIEKGIVRRLVTLDV